MLEENSNTGRSYHLLLQGNLWNTRNFFQQYKLLSLWKSNKIIQNTVI